MAEEAPKSRPEPPQPSRAINPQPAGSVYGGQWGGGGGKPAPEETGEPDRPQPLTPPRNGK